MPQILSGFEAKKHRNSSAVSRLFGIAPATKYAQIESRDSWCEGKEQNAGVAGTTQSICDEVLRKTSQHELAVFGGRSNREGMAIDAAKGKVGVFSSLLSL